LAVTFCRFRLNRQNRTHQDDRTGVLIRVAAVMTFADRDGQDGYRIL
jgi:hypothetical protein